MFYANSFDWAVFRDHFFAFADLVGVPEDVDGRAKLFFAELAEEVFEWAEIEDLPLVVVGWGDEGYFDCMWVSYVHIVIFIKFAHWYVFIPSPTRCIGEGANVRFRRSFLL